MTAYIPRTITIDLGAPLATAIAEAVIASANYEAERGRPCVPAVNLALMRHLSVARGIRAIGACKVADALAGEHLPADLVIKSRRTGRWIDHSEKGWYLSDECRAI